MDYNKVNFNGEHYRLLDRLVSESFYRRLNPNYKEEKSMYERLMDGNEHDQDSLEVLCNVGTDWLSI